jgi:hypothetical protein
MAAPQMTAILDVQGVLVRGIIFFVALKVVALQGNGSSRRMSLAMLGTLLAMAVRMSVQ